MAPPIRPAAAAKRHLKKADEIAPQELAGHLMVMHHFNCGLVHAHLGSKAEAQASLEAADAVRDDTAYREALSADVYVHDYELAKAMIWAVLSKTTK